MVMVDDNLEKNNIIAHASDHNGAIRSRININNKQSQFQHAEIFQLPRPSIQPLAYSTSTKKTVSTKFRYSKVIQRKLNLCPGIRMVNIQLAVVEIAVFGFGNVKTLKNSYPTKRVYVCMRHRKPFRRCQKSAF